MHNLQFVVFLSSIEGFLPRKASCYACGHDVARMTLDNSVDETAQKYVEIHGTQGVRSESANPPVNTVVKTGIAVDGQRN